MSNNSILINPITKDYVIDQETGKPKEDVGLKTPAFFRLRIPRERWLYSPNNQYGSDFFRISKNITSSAGSRLIDVANRALQHFIEENRATDIEVSLVERSRHGAGLQIRILENPQTTEDIFFIPIGVGNDVTI